MAYQTVFKRYELKYILNKFQKDKLLELMNTYMQIDDYGRTTIRNIYFDTDSYRLIRRSIEKPLYKEKLRILSYKLSDNTSTVYIELKKKYKNIVYKRRLALQEKNAMDWICGNKPYKDCVTEPSQIGDEIEYFLRYYSGLKPAMFISYDREAYYTLDGSDFRVTFDENVTCRTDDMVLTKDIYGNSIVGEDVTLLELKCSGGIPLWMTTFLSENHIYKTSFSKYGMGYQKFIYPFLDISTKGIIHTPDTSISYNSDKYDTYLKANFTETNINPNEGLDEIDEEYDNDSDVELNIEIDLDDE